SAVAMCNSVVVIVFFFNEEAAYELETSVEVSRVRFGCCLPGRLPAPGNAAADAGGDAWRSLGDLVHLCAVLSVDWSWRAVHRAAARQQGADRRARRDHRRGGRGDPQPGDLVRAAHLVPRHVSLTRLRRWLRYAGADQPQPLGTRPVGCRARRDLALQGRDY